MVDDQQFDRLVRRVADIGSRRRLFGGGVAALFALVGVGRTSAARPYSVPLGGVCYHDRQCIPAEPGPSENIVYCAANGFDWDGQQNCCRYYGGQCRADNECCGTLDCATGFCGTGYGTCGDYGEYCQIDGECCGTLGCYNSFCSTPYEICSGYGEFCRDARDCCGTLLCDSGTCITPYR